MGEEHGGEVEVTGLRAEHLDEAAALVAARYRDLRSRVPSLPPRYEDAGVMGEMLRGLGRATGAVALQGGRLVGFVAGLVLADLLGKRSFYCPEWAHAAEPGNSRRIYEEMYQHVSEQWVSDGCALHALTLLAHDRQAIEAWQWLGFGLAAVDGLRDLSPLPGGHPDLDVRRATEQDAGEVTAFGRALERHMAGPPVFWPHDPEDYAAWLRQADHVAWLAYEQGEAVGCLGLELGTAGGCQIVRDGSTAGITLAYTRQEARRSGILTALLNEAFAWAAASGYARCAADWEAMNPPANRFWTSRFQPVCYSLLRCIDERLVGHSPRPGEGRAGSRRP
jgi:GNAT superfamily N-acetyltransferase